MCDPVSLFIGSTAISGASAISGFAQADAQASAAERRQRELHAFNTELSLQSASLSYAQLGERQAQEALRAALDIEAISRDSLTARGSISASAGAAGIRGRSLDDLLTEFRRQEADFTFRTLLNEELQRDQLEKEKTAVQLQTQGRIASTVPEGVARPNPFTTGLDFFGQTLQSAVGFGLFDSGNPPDPDAPD